MSTFVSRTLRTFALGGVAAAVLTAAPASAETLAVNATVTANCSATTTAVAFGNVNVLSGTNADLTGGLSVTCTNGTAWSASADAGTGTGATMASRKMTSGANLLNYTLYTDTGRTTVWGNAADTTTVKITGTGTGAAQANTIYGRVPSGQNTVKAGSYADTVTVTITF